MKFNTTILVAALTALTFAADCPDACLTCFGPNIDSQCMTCNPDLNYKRKEITPYGCYKPTCASTQYLDEAYIICKGKC